MAAMSSGAQGPPKRILPAAIENAGAFQLSRYSIIRWWITSEAKRSLGALMRARRLNSAHSSSWLRPKMPQLTDRSAKGNWGMNSPTTSE